MSTFSRTLAQWWRHRVLQAMQCVPLRALGGPEGVGCIPHRASKHDWKVTERLLLMEGNGMQSFNGMHSSLGAVLFFCQEKTLETCRILPVKVEMAIKCSRIPRESPAPDTKLLIPKISHCGHKSSSVSVHRVQQKHCGPLETPRSHARVLFTDGRKTCAKRAASPRRGFSRQSERPKARSSQDGLRF